MTQKLTALVATAFTTLAGCCSEPWEDFPQSALPDRSCSTGDVHGYDVYIWDCLAGQHVVVAQYSAEMTCRDPVRETSDCGTQTALERRLALTAQICAGPRAGREWRR